MTKRERVLAAIHHQKSEGVPSSFSLHFPAEAARGDAAVEAHLNFFQQADTDILKIMCENFVPALNGITGVSDMARACTKEDSHKLISAQLEQVKKILDRCGNDGYTMSTVHGITASSLHPIEHSGVPYEQAREIQCQFLRDNPTVMHDCMKRVRDTMCELSVRCVELGVDGIYYASLGGEPRYFTDEEFGQYIAPLELEILDEIRKAGGHALLHICKDGLNMDRYAPYAEHIDMVNWGVYEAPFSLEEGKKLFPGVTILGGLQNRGGILESGSDEALVAEVKRLCALFPDGGFILGADCTIPTDQNLERLRLAVNTARSC